MSTLTNIQQGKQPIVIHQETETQQLLSAQDIAQRCNIPVSTIYEMARQGRIGGVVRLGRRIRFNPTQFEAWLDAGGEALSGGWRHESEAV